MGIQVLEERELLWRISMILRHQILTVDLYACLEYLMVRFSIIIFCLGKIYLFLLLLATQNQMSYVVSCLMQIVLWEFLCGLSIILHIGEQLKHWVSCCLGLTYEEWNYMMIDQLTWLLVQNILKVQYFAGCTHKRTWLIKIWDFIFSYIYVTITKCY